MARGKTEPFVGVYKRADRGGWWLSFTDAQGRKKRRKVEGAHTLQQARAALAGELAHEMRTSVRSR